MTNCISTAAAAGALGSIINASAPHAEERMVCVTLRWRKADSNSRSRGKGKAHVGSQATYRHQRQVNRHKVVLRRARAALRTKRSLIPPPLLIRSGRRDGHGGNESETDGCAVAENPGLSILVRTYRPDAAPFRYGVDAVQSASSDAQWRRSSYSGEPRLGCGRFPLLAPRQAPMSPHQETANPVSRAEPAR